MMALRKITWMPAERLENYVPEMKNKGRIRAGADADVTMFDANSVIDGATFEKPMRPLQASCMCLSAAFWRVRT